MSDDILERRSFAVTGLEHRDNGARLNVRGIAVVFNALSEDLGGFREQFAPGSLDGSLAQGRDVLMLYSHDTASVLASTRSGSLKLTRTAVGLEVAAELSRADPDVQRLAAKLEAGTVSSMSFGFRAVQERWHDDAGTPVRTVVDAELIEVSAVAMPAYPQTALAARARAQHQGTDMDTMTTSLDLRTQRTRLIDQQREYSRRAEQQNRSFTRNEKDTYDQLARQIGDLDERIDRLSAEEDRSRRQGTPYTKTMLGHTSASRSNDQDDELAAFLAGETRAIDLRAPTAAELRTLSTGTSGAGGATIPETFIERLYEHLIESSAIRQAGPEVIRTDGGSSLGYPKTTTHVGAAAGIVDEADTIGESNPVFDQVKFGAFKYGVLVKVTRELIEDTAIDLPGYLARQGGRALGNASGAHFITGNGTTQPEGIAANVTVGKVAALTDAVTADELLDLYFDVLPEHRARGSWLLSDKTWAAVRKLKDQELRYLVGDLADGASPRLLGRPVVVDPNMADFAADARPILFGDFGSAYAIREAGSLRIERSDDAYFAQDLVGFRMLMRLDGRVIDPAAVKALKMDDGI